MSINPGIGVNRKNENYFAPYCIFLSQIELVQSGFEQVENILQVSNIESELYSEENLKKYDAQTAKLIEKKKKETKWSLNDHLFIDNSRTTMGFAGDIKDLILRSGKEYLEKRSIVDLQSELINFFEKYEEIDKEESILKRKRIFTNYREEIEKQKLCLFRESNIPLIKFAQKEVDLANEVTKEIVGLNLEMNNSYNKFLKVWPVRREELRNTFFPSS